MVRRRVDSSMLVRGGSCLFLSPEALKKSAGRRAILALVLAARGDGLCNMLPEREECKYDGWGLGSSAAEWSI